MMKKKCIYIFVAWLFLTNISAWAVSNSAPMGSFSDVINKQNQTQLRDYEVEKKYVETVEEDLKKEKRDLEKDDNEKIENIFKGNLTYNPKFKLNKVIFEGNTVYSDKKLIKFAKKLLGNEVYLDDVMELVLKVSRFYQKNGYLTSYAYLPPQEIDNGVVKIAIKESRVSQKDIRGNRFEKEWYLRNIALGGRGLGSGRIFNSKDLQGAMKNINNESYLKGSAAISKNEVDDTVIELDIADRYPISIDFGWDDYGRNYTGRQRATGIIGIDNLTGFGDKIYGGAILSSGTTGALAGYDIPINQHGTRLGFDYSYSNVRLGGPYGNLDIKGKATSYGLHLTHPLINTATKQLSATVAVNAVNSNTRSQALNQGISDYNLRVLRTSLHGLFDDRKGRTIGSLGFDVGTDALGASKNINGAQQSAFYKVVASLARIQRLPKNCLGIVRINGQYSPQSLYAAEQMYIGGAHSVRGYQPSELIGDYGVAGSVEIRSPIPHLDALFPKKYEHFTNRVKLAAFYDWGYVKEHNDLYGYPDNFLQSVGMGTYINLTDAISLQMGVGFPLGRKYYNDDNARFYFSFNSEIDKIFMKPVEKL